MPETMVAEVMAELAALEDPKMREANEKRGDDHGVNLSKLRAVAKKLKTQQQLAVQLWATGDTAARLVALLICRPKAFGREELDTMLRQARAPKFPARHPYSQVRLRPTRCRSGNLPCADTPFLCCPRRIRLSPRQPSARCR